MRPRRRGALRRRALAVCLLLGAPACRSTEPRTGSETNFLRLCDASCDAGLSCVCGVCTRPCAARDECTPLAAGALCEAATTACAAAEGEAFCDLPCLVTADCAALGGAFRCQGGHCRLPDGGNAGGAGGVPGRGGAGGGDTSGAASAGGGPAGDGCLATTLALGDNDRTVVVDGTPRRYVVRLPAAYRGATPVPLVLDFHTLGGSPAGEAAHSGYLEVSEREGFLVAWPEGLEGAWNFGPCCTTSREVDDVGFARALVRQLQAEACVDPARIYAVGVANGGGMAYELACSAADVFAGIAPSAFDLLVDEEQPCRPTRPVTVIAFRGTADPLMPYEGGAQQPPNGVEGTLTFLGAIGTFERWAEFDRCTGAPSAADANGCSTYADCADGVEVTLCTEEGGGMTWGSAELGWATLSRHARP